MRRNKDDRETNASPVQLILELEATGAWETNIEHETTRCIGALSLEKLSPRTEQFNAQPYGANQTTNCIPHGRVVIYHKYDRF
jgi:hypothetical protein